LASTKSLHFGQYQALSYSKISGSWKSLKQSDIDIEPDFEDDPPLSETIFSYITSAISFAFFSHYISISTNFCFIFTSLINLSSLNFS
jgi:hypothetical protein